MPKNITVQKILFILLHRLPMIILSGVLVGLMFFLYSSFLIKPVYSTSTMIYIQNYGRKQTGNAETDDVQSATQSPNSESAQSNNEAAQKIFNSDISGSARVVRYELIACVGCVFLNNHDFRVGCVCGLGVQPAAVDTDTGVLFRSV